MGFDVKEPLDLRVVETRLNAGIEWNRREAKNIESGDADSCVPLPEEMCWALLTYCRALRAALLEAQEALSPFYAYACLEDDLSSGHSAPDEIPVVETTRNNIHAAVTVGDFRRAREVRERAAAVLAQVKDE